MADQRTSEIEEEAKRKTLSFGEHLFVAREQQGLSVTEIAKAIHLSEDVITAVERSDVSALPDPIFVQGYLRAYAKYLGVSVEGTLEEYARAVPHRLESELSPRSALPKQATSETPHIKIVSLLLIAIIVAAAVYGSYSYYSEIVSTRNEFEDDSELLLPDISNSGQSDVYNEMEDNFNAPADYEQNSENIFIQNEKVVDVVDKESVDIVSEQPDINKVEESDAEPTITATQTTATGDDVIELTAYQNSWVEIVDANNTKLYYNLIVQDHSLSFKGTSPFKVFLGNAPAVEIKVNDTSVDMTKFVRSNKIAQFEVSVVDQQVVFH